ncbi:DUF4158 domain-containing protein [Streptosporangium canum]|uniref:DUF4158 domain-containing protein n=1 Tax=Streptosporangium canum TaxID=324952 RepID=UPI0037881EF3
MSLSSPADVTFDELSESVADDEAARVCLVEWWSQVPDPRSLLGRWQRFFYLDADALAEVAKKRGPHNRIGWGQQRGTARMLGTFLADPGDVPHVAVDDVADQLGVSDLSCIKHYAERLPAQHEHAREIRELLGLREFGEAEAEAELRVFVASRAAQTRDSGHDEHRNEKSR